MLRRDAGDADVEDPLPSGALLLVVRAELFGQYFCRESPGTSTYSTIEVQLQGTEVDTRKLTTSALG